MYIVVSIVNTKLCIQATKSRTQSEQMHQYMFIHTRILTYNRTYPYIPTGIIQMIFGICLRGVNSWNFRQMVDFFTEFMPMIIFAVGFFGYMVILIFVKWSINWDHRMAIGSCSYDQQGIIIITHKYKTQQQVSLFFPSMKHTTVIFLWESLS